MFRAACNVTNRGPSPLWIPFRTRAKVSKIGGFRGCAEDKQFVFIIFGDGKTWLVVELEAGLIIFDESGVDWGVEIQVLRD